MAARSKARTVKLTTGQNTIITFTTKTKDEQLTPFGKLVKKGNLKSVKKYLEEQGEGFDINFAVNASGNTAAHVAAGEGNVTVLRLLVKHGADILRETPKPLNAMVANTGGLGGLNTFVYGLKSVAVLKYLVEELEYDITQNLNTAVGHPSLHACAQLGTPSAFDYLLSKGLDLDELSSTLCSVLMSAVQVDNVEMARHLIESVGVDAARVVTLDRKVPLKSGMDHNNLYDMLLNRGSTALHSAARQGALKCAELLLKKGLDPSLVVEQGHTAVTFAIHTGNLEMVKLLLEARPDAVRMPADTGTRRGGFERELQPKDPLLEAIERKQVDILAYLLSREGAEYNRLHHVSSQSALMYTAIEPQHGNRQFYEMKMVISPLLLAVALEQVESVRLLLEKDDLNIGERFDSKVPHFYTPLHCAASKGNLEIVKMLCEREAGGIPVDVKDPQERTPLHMAGDHQDVRAYLVRRAVEEEKQRKKDQKREAARRKRERAKQRKAEKKASSTDVQQEQLDEEEKEARKREKLRKKKERQKQAKARKRAEREAEEAALREQEEAAAKEEQERKAAAAEKKRKKDEAAAAASEAKRKEDEAAAEARRIEEEAAEEKKNLEKKAAAEKRKAQRAARKRRKERKKAEARRLARELEEEEEEDLAEKNGGEEEVASKDRTAADDEAGGKVAPTASKGSDSASDNDSDSSAWSVSSGDSATSSGKQDAGAASSSEDATAAATQATPEADVHEEAEEEELEPTPSGSQAQSADEESDSAVIEGSLEAVELRPKIKRRLYRVCSGCGVKGGEAVQLQQCEHCEQLEYYCGQAW